jgi:hypothetical protein
MCETCSSFCLRRPALSQKRRIVYVNVTLLAASLFFVTRGYALQPVHNFESHENWEKIQGLIGDHTSVWRAPPFSPLLMAQGKPVYDSGHSEYFDSIMLCGGYQGAVSSRQDRGRNSACGGGCPSIGDREACWVPGLKDRPPAVIPA